MTTTQDVKFEVSWRDLKIGDLVYWRQWVQVREIRTAAPYGPNGKYVATLVTTDGAYGCEKDSTFEVRRRIEFQDVYGVRLELFDDGSVWIEGEPYVRKERR